MKTYKLVVGDKIVTTYDVRIDLKAFPICTRMQVCHVGNDAFGKPFITLAIQGYNVGHDGMHSGSGFVKRLDFCDERNHRHLFDFTELDDTFRLVSDTEDADEDEDDDDKMEETRKLKPGNIIELTKAASLDGMPFAAGTVMQICRVSDNQLYCTIAIQGFKIGHSGLDSNCMHGVYCNDRSHWVIDFSRLALAPYKLITGTEKKREIIAPKSGPDCMHCYVFFSQHSGCRCGRHK